MSEPLDETPKPSRPRLALAIIFVLIFIGLVAVILDWREVQKILRETNWKVVPWALVFTLVSYLCISMGFAIVNELFGSRIRRRDLASIGFISTVLNHLLSAGGTAGLSVRYLMMRDKNTNLKDILAASLFHSYFTSLGMLALLPIGLLYLFIKHPLSQGASVGIVASAILLILVFLLATAIVFSSSLRDRILSRLGRFASKVARRDVRSTLEDFSSTMTKGVLATRSNKGKFIWLLFFVFTDWASSIVALWFCFNALGTPLKMGVLLTGFAIGVTAGVLSMIPGGVGVQEGSMSGIYALLGVPLSSAVLAAILFRLVYYLVPYLVSLGFYRRLLQRLNRKAAPANSGGSI
jgi:uncharacterized protein (TIRG00374 family)